VTLTAVRTSATLSVVAGSQDVISVDGKVVGSGQWLGTLPAGEHVVRVTAPGKKAYETHLQLTPKGSRTLQVTLADEKSATVWPWLVGGAAVAVGAAIGGYLLFKPGDQPGKAPQGTLGTIYLTLGR
jgi:phosphate/sulfate permease